LIPWLANAWAETPWWVGVPVQSVQIIAPAGGAPSDDLDPLLRVRQSQPLNPADIRLDVATLFRAGDYASVEADVEPWVEETETGELIPAVLLKYRVVPAPRVRRVRVVGNDALGREAVLQAARLEPGAPWYPSVDTPAIQRAALEAYLMKGYPNATIEIQSAPRTNRSGEAQVDLTLRVNEGQPRLLSKLTFTGASPYSSRQLRRIARGVGLSEGRPFALGAVPKVEEAIRDALAAPGDLLHPRGGTPLYPLGGWTQARVVSAVTSPAPNTLEVTVHIDPGPRLNLDVSGLELNAKAKVREALEIDSRLRLGRGWLEDAPDRLAGYLQRRGYFAATAEVTLDRPENGTQTLHVDAHPGPPHVLVPEAPLFGPWVRRSKPGIDFVGNVSLHDDDLRSVMEQASEEVLRLHRVTRPEIELGLTAARDLYRSRGFPQAKLTLTQLIVEPKASAWRWPLLSGLARVLQIRPPNQIRLEINVDEGPQLTLASLEIQGSTVPDPAVTARVKELVGAPYSPQALDQLAQRIIRIHAEHGYLEATARVIRPAATATTTSAIVVVTPGPLVLLRSQAFRGSSDTNNTFLRRHFALPLGKPLTQADLDRVRRELYDLGIYRGVSTDVLGDGVTRDLLVSLSQRPRYGFELGTGLSTDQGLRAFGRATRYNLWGLAHRVELFGVLGLDYQSDSLRDWSLDILNPEWRAALSYQAPKFPFANQQLSIDVLAREQLQERYWRMQRTGIAVSVETTFGRDKSFTLRVRGQLQQRRLIAVDPGVLLDGEPWAPLRVDGDVPLPSPWREQHSVSVFGLWDRRDDKVMPNKGFLASAVTEISPKLQLGTGSLAAVPFAKGELRFSGFIPVGALTLHLAGQGGHARVLSSTGTLAVEDRYRLGGTGTMRGFRRDAVGPRNLVDQPDLDWGDHLAPAINQSLREHPTRWVSTGGDTSGQATVELLTPLPALGLHDWQGYWATLFTDIGNVWLLGGPTTSDRNYRELYSPILRYSVGAGLRVATPVGPLQLDLASNPDAVFASGEKGKLLREQWSEPGVRFHVSLGTLF
jgi:outer membrane protein assembly factor BamA